jgi:hypothetical protein
MLALLTCPLLSRQWFFMVLFLQNLVGAKAAFVVIGHPLGLCFTIGSLLTIADMTMASV